MNEKTEKEKGNGHCALPLVHSATKPSPPGHPLSLLRRVGASLAERTRAGAATTPRRHRRNSGAERIRPRPSTSPWPLRHSPPLISLALSLFPFPDPVAEHRRRRASS